MIDILKSITAPQWITIGVAFIAPIISLFGVIYTNNTTKKLTKDNINANITAKARIEWIQSVRKATAELITAYHKLLSVKSDECKREVQEKTALFVLFFGPDDDSISKIIATDLFDKRTNKGKNNLLVEFINKLHSDVTQCLRNCESLSNYKKQRNQCYQCLSKETGEIDPEKISCQTDEYTYFTISDCEKNKKYLNDKIETLQKFELSLSVRLNELSEIMRIYCKIEWNKAKEGK